VSAGASPRPSPARGSRPRADQPVGKPAAVTTSASPLRALLHRLRRLQRRGGSEREPSRGAPARVSAARLTLASPGISPSARTRAYLAGALLTAGLAGLTARAWGLQVEQGDRFRAQAARQHLLTLETPAPRGAILDRVGRPLAVTADADSVWANPRAIGDVTATAEKLAALVGADVRVLEARLASDKHFAWVARHVSPEVAAAVRAAKLPGIDLTHEPRRWYPARTSGSTLIGRANVDGQGLEGVELALDRLLTGRRASSPAMRDARGRTMLADGMVAAEPGATVRLTIDRTIQSIADAALADALLQFKAAAGVAVVLDVATGDVLALANAPTFDPNSPSAHSGARNRAITDAYEIGSVMKVFTVAAALDLGLTRPDEVFDVEGGSWQIAGKTVRDVHHDTELTTSGIIKRSSNVGAVKLGLRVGRDRLYDAFRRFGFAAETGIELPGEQTGVMRPGSRWRDIELVTMSYGYGMTVSPLQVAAALAAIGNDGMYNPPRVIAEIIGADGAPRSPARPPARPMLSPAAARAMLPMLASVFDGGKQAGTAGKLVVPGFTCGGKSGTAHKLDPRTRRYAEKLYLSSFAGLAPIDDPRLAIVVLIDEPTGKDYFGGKVAGPVFATIASEALRYLGVPGQDPVAQQAARQAALVAERARGAPAPTPRRAASAAPAGIDEVELPRVQLPVVIEDNLGEMTPPMDSPVEPAADDGSPGPVTSPGPAPLTQPE
jgi:cell division protein FtsI (penicillin-binding protein 3)